jgi:hypothetical protein
MKLHPAIPTSLAAMLAIFLAACAAQSAIYPSAPATNLPTANQISPTITPSVTPTPPPIAQTKLAYLTADAQTLTARPTYNDATVTAILSQKATGRAAMALTMTAYPTVTPTPTLPPDAPPCQAADLTGEARTNGAGGSITFGVSITNRGSQLCFLQGPPEIALVDNQGKALDIHINNECFPQCGPTPDPNQTPSMATQTALAPLQTVQASLVLNGKIGLAPGASAVIFMIWSNWCQPFPQGGVRVQLTLPGGSLIEIPGDAGGGGRCDAPGEPSSMMVSQYSY